MRSNHLAFVLACIWTATFTATPTAAQQPDSATINGTIGASEYRDHTWTLTLHGLSYSHDDEIWNYVSPDNYYARSITRVYATSFDFQFQGPDAVALNAIVSSVLANGGHQDEPFIELRNYTYFDEDWDWLVYGGDWVIAVRPLDYQQEFSFFSLPNILQYPWFTVDANGYPVLEPFTCSDAWAFFYYNRPGQVGSIGQQGGNTISVSSVGFSLPGDYNRDGAVDAADYVVWRDSPGDFGGDPDGYNTWRTHFGQPAASNPATGNMVPEPASGCNIVLLSILWLIRRRRARTSSL